MLFENTVGKAVYRSSSHITRKQDLISLKKLTYIVEKTKNKKIFTDL
jgi:hypothetical protein